MLLAHRYGVHALALSSAARPTMGLQYAEIKLESLILAQSERWRRA
jgi:hypothetical protein